MGAGGFIVEASRKNPPPALAVRFVDGSVEAEGLLDGSRQPSWIEAELWTLKSVLAQQGDGNTPALSRFPLALQQWAAVEKECKKAYTKHYAEAVPWFRTGEQIMVSISEQQQQQREQEQGKCVVALPAPAKPRQGKEEGLTGTMLYIHCCYSPTGTLLLFLRNWCRLLPGMPPSPCIALAP